MGKFNVVNGPPMYVLRDRVPVRVTDFVEWLTWFATDERFIARDTRDDGVVVSTVFLCTGFAHAANLAPLLFETMAFRSDGTIVAGDRCATYDGALKQHARVLDDAPRVLV